MLTVSDVNEEPSLAFTAMGKITGELVSGFINTSSRRATFPGRQTELNFFIRKTFL